MGKKHGKRAISERPPAVEEELVGESAVDTTGDADMIEELLWNSGPTPQELRISPYTEAPIALHIGPDEITHYVPRHLVPPGLKKTDLEHRLHLPDLDMETGHTLTHYLYTGTYETLRNEDNSSTFGACIELKRAILVYITASNYNLLNLQQLAMHKIEDHTVRLSVFEILEVIKENFSRLSSDSMVHDYLRKRTRAAFEEDHTVFKSKPFLESLDNAALNKFTMAFVMDLYSDRLSQMLTREKELFKKIDSCDQTIRNLSIGKAAPKQNITMQQDFITPLADGPTMEECCGQEAFKQKVVSSEELRTISYPSSECATDALLEEVISDGQCFEELQAPLQDTEINEPPNWMSIGWGKEETKVEIAGLVEDTEAAESEKKVINEEEAAPAAARVEQLGTQLAREIDTLQDLKPRPCPLQAEHMLEEKRWMKCNLCRATLQQVAVQLVRANWNTHI